MWRYVDWSESILGTYKSTQNLLATIVSASHVAPWMYVQRHVEKAFLGYFVMDHIGPKPLGAKTSVPLSIYSFCLLIRSVIWIPDFLFRLLKQYKFSCFVILSSFFPFYLLMPHYNAIRFSQALARPFWKKNKKKTAKFSEKAVEPYANKKFWQ